MKYIYIPYNEHKTSTFNPFVTNLVEVGDFSVQGNLNSEKVTKSPSLFQNVVSYTIDTAPTTPYNKVTSSLTDATLKPNYKKIESFLKYSSATNSFLQALEYIFYNYPAALNVKNNVNGTIGVNVLNYFYNQITNISEFVVNTNFISNPMEINYLSVDLPNREKYAVHRTLKDSWENYVLVVDNEIYELANFSGSNRYTNSYISLAVKGNPFTEGNSTQTFFLKTKESLKQDFYLNAPLFVNVLLRNEGDTEFRVTFDDKNYTSIGTLLYELTFLFPKTDVYNIDFYTSKFDTFKAAILEYLQKKDSVDTNIVIRKYIEPTLLTSFLNSFENTENKGDKLETLLATYAFSFDERFKFVNGLKNLNIITYDGLDNMPLELIDSYISSKGIKVFENLSLEKKKQLALTLPWILKSKGTKAAIYYIFELLNIPLELVNLKEHVKTIESPVDIATLSYYLNLIYGSTDLSTLSVDKFGFPKPNSTYIFEDSNYWSQYYVLDSALNNKYIQKTSNTSIQEVIYDNMFESSGSTFDYILVSSACYDLQSSIVTDILAQDQFDECGCLIEQEDNTFVIDISPVDLYSGCTSPIIDVWQECLGLDQIMVHVTTYGGSPPYTYYGTQSGQVLALNEDFTVYVEDSLGCQSIEFSGTTYCFNVNCSDNPLLVNLSYTCEADDNGALTGNAIVVLNVSGGTAPYIINGNENGDILPDGETIVTQIVDALGCSSDILTLLIDCQAPNLCTSLLLHTDASVVRQRGTTATVNVNYDIQNVPNTTAVQSVVMTITEISGGTIAGNPRTELFSGDFGSVDIGVTNLNNPNPLVFEISIVIVLEDGCQYTDTHQLSIDCSTAGNSSIDYYNTLT